MRRKAQFHPYINYAFTKKANYAEISKHLPRSKLIYRSGTMLIAITGRSPSLRRFNANQNVMVIRHNRTIITRLISPMLLFVAYTRSLSHRFLNHLFHN